MRRIYCFFILLLGIVGCSNDDKVDFDISISEKDISFKPIAGGAAMYYKLPNDSDIYTIRVSYKDNFGNEIVREGSYLCDSLVLDGFTEACSNVPASVSLLNLEERKSTPLNIFFDTKDAVPVAFFKGADVSPCWDGFQLTYGPQEKGTGYAHVFYVGMNPHTQKQDTLLVKTFPILQKGDTLTFTLQQQQDMNTVVVRTEDFRGYKVKQQVWENVEAYKMEQMASSDFEFLDPLKLNMEDETHAVGVKYLFDGDKKGERRLGISGDKYYTFLSKPDAVGKYWIIDLKEGKIPASVRLYGMLFVNSWTWIWNYQYVNKLPNEVTVYASNDKDDATSWKKIGYFYQSPEARGENDKWAYRCNLYPQITEVQDLNEKQPAYLNVEIGVSSDRYRYLKLEVNSVFKNTVYGDLNLNNYVSFHELEVFVKKE